MGPERNNRKQNELTRDPELAILSDRELLHRAVDVFAVPITYVHGCTCDHCVVGARVLYEVNFRPLPEKQT